MAELPKFRPGDQIDITEAQLQLIKDIYDKAQKEGTVDSVSFFVSVRRNAQIRNLSSALAREPEDTSRIPRETFQQVFDRMESTLKGKKFYWAVIVEYFTKRGRPLTNEEIQQFRQEDKNIEEQKAYEQRQREIDAEERMAKMKEAAESNVDFETYQARMA